MTLRTLLHRVDLEKVFVHLSERDGMDLNEAKQKYTTVINTLLKKPDGKVFLPIEVQYGQDQGLDVFARNPKYVAPKEGLLPWGCRRGEKPPKGYYDANATKHCRIFAIGFTSWDKIIDSEIVSSLSPEVTVAEVLREITFYGWSEKDIKKQFDVIDQRVKEAIKEVEGGRASKRLPGKRKSKGTKQ